MLSCNQLVTRYVVSIRKPHVLWHGLGTHLLYLLGQYSTAIAI